MNPINHVAIIMDGNGRWGIKNKKNRNEGHKAGLKTIEKIIKVALEKKIKFLTLYTFSTENWKRPKTEIKFLFKLLENFLIQKINFLIQHNIKLIVIGEKKPFSTKIKKLLSQSEKKTSKFKNLQINLALNYGSRNEILRSLKMIKKKKLKINSLNFIRNLYTSSYPDPDILIRTGNTRRLSNFLLWQIAYTEIFFEKKLWPDFKENDFNRIINEFRKLKRNFGNI